MSKKSKEEFHKISYKEWCNKYPDLRTSISKGEFFYELLSIFSEIDNNDNE